MSASVPTGPSTSRPSSSSHRSPDAFERSRRRQKQRQKNAALILGASGVALALALFLRGRNTPSNGVADVSSKVLPVVQTASVVTPTPRPKPAPKPRNVLPPWAKGKTLRQVPLRPGVKAVALTFDDGPWPDYTAKVLQILREYNAKATFYMVGQEVARRPKTARSVRDAGHEIGNHSRDHPSRPRDPVAQVVRTDAVIKKETGVTSLTFRPPYGIEGNGMARRALKQGNAVILWSADSTDWMRPGSSKIAARTLRQVSPGGIVLMHDGGGHRAQTVAALHTIMRTLKDRGYKFVTISELLKMRYVAPKPRKKLKAKTRGKKPVIKKP